MYYIYIFPNLFNKAFATVSISSSRKAAGFYIDLNLYYEYFGK